MLLVDLIEKVENYGKLFQSNTDGLYLCVDNMEKVEQIKRIAHEWEQRTGLELEFDIYDEIYQKDVNNYILIKDVYGKKKYKTKGSYLKKKKLFDNDLPIVTEALIEYFVNKIPLEETINNCNELIKFQKVIKLSDKYKHVIYGNPVKENGRIVSINGEKLHNKVNRIFASNDENDKGIFKAKSGKEITYEKIALTSEHLFIDNGDIHNKEVPTRLDREFYIALAKDRLEQILSKDSNNQLETKEKESISDYLFKCYCETWYQHEDIVEFFAKISEKYKLNNKAIKKYFIANCCSFLGKTKKVLDFAEIFSWLYGKKSITVASLNKKITDKNILEIINKNSELNSSGKSLVVINMDKTLREIFEYLPNVDISLQDILLTQADLFNKFQYINEEYKGLYVVQNYANNITPTVILYDLATGETKYYYINKEMYKILPVVGGDVLLIQSKDILEVPKQKISHKDEKGVNVLVDDLSRDKNLLINKYNIYHRMLHKEVENNLI